MKTKHYMSILACLMIIVSGCDNMDPSNEGGNEPGGNEPGAVYESPVFNDDNFEAFILGKFDTDKDNTINETEAASIVELEYSEETDGALSSLEGISSFYNLKSFVVKTDSDVSSTITTIDFSNNKKLETIDIQLETLDELNLEGLTTLKEITIAFSAISDLDVTAFADLEVLRAHGTNIASIDLSNNAKLAELSVYSTPLTELNTSSCPVLKTLVAGSSTLASLTLNNPNLTELNLMNGITDQEVDFSSLIRLKQLWISNAEVKEIDLSKSASLTYVFGQKFPNLETLDLSAASRLNTLHISEHNKLTTVRLNKKVEGKFTIVGHWEDDEFINVIIEYIENEDIELDDYSTLIVDDKATAAIIKKFDTDYNNKISKTELAAVIELELKDLNITTTEGLEVFPSLEKLVLSGNSLTEFDASSFTGLKHLDLSNNQLTSINVKSISGLEYFDASGNSLSGSISRIQLPYSSLTHVYISDNPSLNVDLSDCSSLVEADFSNTATNTIYTAYWYASELKTLKMAGTGISGALKFPYLTSLETIDISNTAITSIDISAAAAKGTVKKILAEGSSLGLVIVGPGNSLGEGVIEGAEDCGVLNVTNPTKDMESNIWNYISAFTAGNGATEKDFTINYAKTSKGFVINAGGEASITATAGRKVLKFFAIGVNGTPTVEIVRSSNKAIFTKSTDSSSWGESYKSTSENPLTVRNNAAAATDETKLLIDGDADWHKFNLGAQGNSSNNTEEGETITFKVNGNQGEKVIIFGINLSTSRDDEE